MDCPDCGVYNPDERTICWRCDQGLPKREEPKKRKDPAMAMRRAWILILVVLVIWVAMTWLLPILMGNRSLPIP